MKPANERIRHRIQRACDCAGAGCARCGGAQRYPRGQAPAAVPQAVYEVLRSPGEPVDDSLRKGFEDQVGHDLSDIRLHAAPHNPVAGVAADAMNAHAFTIGQHIVVADDAPHLGGPDGRRLLHHEMIHAIEHQPRWNPADDGVAMLAMQPSDSADERDAERAGSVSGDPNVQSRVDPDEGTDPDGSNPSEDLEPTEDVRSVEDQDVPAPLAAQATDSSETPEITEIEEAAENPATDVGGSEDDRAEDIEAGLEEQR